MKNTNWKEEESIQATKRNQMIQDITTRDENENEMRKETQMDGTVFAWWCCLLLGAIPLLLQAAWYFNSMLFFTTRLPPGSMGLPFFGETFSFLWYFKFLRRPDDFINSKKHRYGEGVGLYRSHLLGSPTIITCSPSSNKFVIQSTDIFHSRWLSPELMGFTSLANLQGKQHAKLKSFIVDSVNSPNALRQIALMLQPSIISMLQSWAHKKTINAHREIKKLTFESTIKIFASMEPSPLLDELEACCTAVLKGFRANPINFPGTTFHRALLCRRKLTAIFREELKKKKQRKDSISHEYDLMDGLMQAKNDEGRQLSDDEVVDNIISFIIAGYETTANNLMWALYYLAKSPDVLQKLREENAMIRKEKKEDFITVDDISQLKYTAKVVEETIRLGNAVPFLFRVAKRDVEYKGFRIPKGWQVLVWIRNIHTDAKNFEDPLSFKPERWDGPEKPGTYQVFGGGPRICAGNMLARMNMIIFLHYVVLGYKWELINPDAKINYLPQPWPEDGAAMTFSAL